MSSERKTIMKDIMDLHTHTIASGHAYNTLYEMAKSASDKGLILLGAADHSPNMPGASHEFYFTNFKVIPRTLFGVKILMGVELNILDHKGRVDLREGILKRMDFSIASLHTPCYQSGTAGENTNAYLGAIKNPYVNIIGHPDDSRFPVDYETLVAAAAENHKLLEINSSSLNPLNPRENARENYKKMLKLCEHYKASVLLSSDAHIEADVGNHKRAIKLMEEVGFPEELIVNGSLERLGSYIPAIEAAL